MIRTLSMLMRTTCPNSRKMYSRIVVPWLQSFRQDAYYSGSTRATMHSALSSKGVHSPRLA